MLYVSEPRAIVESYSSELITPTTAVGGSIESGTKENILNPEIVANRVFNPSLMLDKLAITLTITKKPPM